MSVTKWDILITDAEMPLGLQRILLSHGLVILADIRNLGIRETKKWRGIGSKRISQLQDFMWDNFKYQIPLENELQENFEYINRLGRSLQEVIIYEDQLDYILSLFKTRVFPRPG